MHSCADSMLTPDHMSDVIIVPLSGFREHMQQLIIIFILLVKRISSYLYFQVAIDPSEF